MIKTRIASTAAIFTFGLAAVGGTVVAIAAPANAETGTTSSSGSSTSSSGSSSAPTAGTSQNTRQRNPMDDLFDRVGTVRNPNFMPTEPDG